MKTIVVTGAKGFIGKNLLHALYHQPNIKLYIHTKGMKLDTKFLEADYIFHLAGVNRPQKEEEFEEVNVGLTREICDKVAEYSNNPHIIFASSIQAELDNPYGRSKKKAEEIIENWSLKTGGKSTIYRLPGVFGKWCKPNYNSVVATFCHNIARGIDIQISDKNKELELVYIDDVVSSFLNVLKDDPEEREMYSNVYPVYPVTLGELSYRIIRLSLIRQDLHVSFLNELDRKLYATYMSYLDEKDFGYPLETKTDDRGCLAEFIKCKYFGQIFVSRTKPGIIRGNHYHNTKVEKFLVLEGDAVVKLKKLLGPFEENRPPIKYEVSGKDLKVIDIPPGYAHSIENVGQTDLVTLFWADELFDKNNPDTYTAYTI